MFNRRNIILFIPIFLFITFPVWRVPVASFLTPRGGDEPEGEKFQQNVTHDFEMEHVTILQNQNGKKTATIRAQKAYTGDSPDDFHLEKVNADIMDAKDQVTNIVAQTGTYNVKSKKLILKVDVVVNRIKDKQIMRSQHLIYDDKRRKVISPGRAEFEGETFNIVGGKMVYNIKDSSYRLSKRVNCVIGGFAKQ